jgi:hypothetical protein
VIAHKKEKRLLKPILNEVSKGHAVDIDSCFATRIIVTELRGGCAAKGVSGDAHLVQVEFAGEPAGWVVALSCCSWSSTNFVSAIHTHISCVARCWVLGDEGAVSKSPPAVRIAIRPSGKAVITVRYGASKLTTMYP